MAFFLAAHALASFLLFRLLSARLGTFAALAGGGLFAILPGGIQAVSWVTAGGDQLAVLFMLLAGAAGDRTLRTGSRAALAACAAAAFCAVASKETAVVLLPALAFLWAVPFSGARLRPLRAFAPCVAAGIGASAAWIVRSLVLGIWLPEYWTGARLEPSHWRDLGTALRGFLIPWSLVADPGAPAPVAAQVLGRLGVAADRLVPVLMALAAGSILVTLAIAAVRGSSGRRAALLVLTALLLVALVPVLPLVGKTGLALSRALYQAAILLAALVATAVGIPGRGRGLALASILPFVILSADLLGCVARAEARIAKQIGVARADLAGFVESRPGTCFIVVQPPSWIDNVPFLGCDLAASAAPPFGSAKRAPLPWATPALLPRCPWLKSERDPVQLLEWSEGRVRPRGPELAAIPDALPALEPDGADARLYRVRGPVTPRAVSAVRIVSPKSAPSASGRVILSAGTKSMTLPFQSVTSGPLVVTVPESAFEDDWFAQPSLASVRVEGLTVEVLPELLPAPPPVDVTTPKLALSSIPRISFATDAPAAAFRITLTVLAEGRPVDLAWTAPATALPPAPDGRRAFAADAPGLLFDGARVMGEVSWVQAAALLAPQAHGRLWSLPGGVRVEALDASGKNVIARSEWIAIFVSR